MKSFVAFLKLVKKAVVPYDTQPLLMYDGHTAHTSHIARNYMAGNFTGLKNVAHSCGYNCKSQSGRQTVHLFVDFLTAIEKLWAAAKTYFKQLLLLHQLPLTQVRFEALVTEALDTISVASVRNLFFANRSFIRD